MLISNSAQPAIVHEQAQVQGTVGDDQKATDPSLAVLDRASICA
jgi:hypothetical protein